jgi:hypothetical protein
MYSAWPAIPWVVAVAAVGCGGPGAASNPAAAPAEGLLRRQLADLPKVGEYLHPLDGNRLEVAPPEGWVPTPKGRTFLVGFHKPGVELPRITINAEDPPEGSPQELTEEGAEAFAARLDQELRAAVAEKRKRVEEYCLPIVLGDNLFIRHVRQVKGSSPCVVQSLQTIKNGRLYTVELIVEINSPRSSEYEKSLRDERDNGYAVAANMRFAPPGETFDPLAELKRSGSPADNSAPLKSRSTESKSPEPKSPAPMPKTEPKPAEPSASQPKPAESKSPKSTPAPKTSGPKAAPPSAP